MDEFLKKKIDAENAKMAHEASDKDGERYVLMFQHGGFDCMIIRNLGHRKVGHSVERVGLCGYVKVPSGHKCYKKKYDAVNKKHDFTVHWGLTYSGDRLDDGSWWLGFDCGHAGDLWYVDDAFSGFSGDVYRDLEYAQEECRKLATQLNEVV